MGKNTVMHMICLKRSIPNMRVLKEAGKKAMCRLSRLRQRLLPSGVQVPGKNRSLLSTYPAFFPNSNLTTVQRIKYSKVQYILNDTECHTKDNFVNLSVLKRTVWVWFLVKRRFPKFNLTGQFNVLLHYFVRG